MQQRIFLNGRAGPCSLPNCPSTVTEWSAGPYATDAKVPPIAHQSHSRSTIHPIERHEPPELPRRLQLESVDDADRDDRLSYAGLSECACEHAPHVLQSD